MEYLCSLWLPILLTGVGLYIASFLVWMVLPHHKKDWAGLPDEVGFGNYLREQNISGGYYMFPFCGSSAEMKSEEFKQRTKQGPVGLLNVWNSPCNMGLMMAGTFAFFLVTAFCLAYLATLGLQPEAEFMDVFRFVGTAGILTYSAANIPCAIWFKQRILGNLCDGIAYGLIAGLIFAMFWPGAS